jgi:methionine aminopeptidase
MRYLSIDEVLQSPGLTWEELCERAEKEIKERREEYRQLQAKRRKMREKLTWDATKTVCMFKPSAVECELSIKIGCSFPWRDSHDREQEREVRIGGKRQLPTNDEDII